MSLIMWIDSDVRDPIFGMYASNEFLIIKRMVTQFC